MKEFIDLHGHYAWGIDDGIEDQQEAIKALKKAQENNIKKIVATPHVICGKHTKKDITLFKERMNELKYLALNYDIEVFQGCELFLKQEVAYQIDEKAFIPIENTKYILCEFDVRKQLSTNETEVEDLLYEIILRGYRPIIAHVERYFKKEIDLERINHFIEMGCVIQINSTSFLHPHGKYILKNTLKLLNNNLVHIIASDTHTANKTRSPNLKEAYRYLIKKYDQKNLELLLYHNQQNILNNKPIQPTEFKKGLFGKIKRR